MLDTRTTTPTYQSDLDELRTVLGADAGRTCAEVRHLARHTVFKVACDLVLIVLIVGVGLQSRHHWPVQVADALYIAAGSVLAAAAAHIYRGKHGG